MGRFWLSEAEKMCMSPEYHNLGKRGRVKSVPLRLPALWASRHRPVNIVALGNNSMRFSRKEEEIKSEH